MREVRDKTVLLVYHKMVLLVNLMAELLAVQTLTDTAVLHVSTVGVAPFFVENISELQLSALRYVIKWLLFSYQQRTLNQRRFCTPH